MTTANEREVHVLLNTYLNAMAVVSGGYDRYEEFAPLRAMGSAILPVLAHRFVSEQTNTWALIALMYAIRKDAGVRPGPAVPPKERGYLAAVRERWTEFLREEGLL